MKKIKADGICDKYIAYYLSKYNIPFENLTLKKNRGKDIFTLRETCEVKKQIGENRQRDFSMLCSNMFNGAFDKIF